MHTLLFLKITSLTAKVVDYTYGRYVRSKLQSPQRVFFDEVILPESTKAAKKCLFIGVDWYNKYIWKKYDSIYWVTVDPIKKNSQYGASEHYIGGFPLGSIELISKHKFDVIYFNGVYGWGLNHLDELKDTFCQLRLLLKNGGKIVFGYNETPERNPCEINIDDKFEELEIDKQCQYIENGTIIFMNESLHRYVIYKQVN
jgi:hypothetical protein